MRKLSEGDEKVYGDIYGLYYSQLCTFVHVRYIRDKDESEEIVQNLFLKLWEKRNNLPKIESLKSYLFTAARNACLNYFEHEAVKRKYNNEVEYKLKKLEFAEPEDAGPEDKIKSATEAINDLPEQTRRIFKLKYIEGLKYKEIAGQLDISEKTVQTLIYRGLKQLRRKVALVLVFIFLIVRILFDFLLNSK